MTQPQVDSALYLLAISDGDRLAYRPARPKIRSSVIRKHAEGPLRQLQAGRVGKGCRYESVGLAGDGKLEGNHTRRCLLVLRLKHSDSDRCQLQVVVLC